MGEVVSCVHEARKHVHVCMCVCVYVYVPTCSCKQGRAAPRPCWGRMDALWVAAGRGELAGEVRSPGTGGSAAPKHRFFVEFLQWQCLHQALITGQGANASLGPPAHALCLAAELCLHLALGWDRERHKRFSNDSPCC